MARRSGGRTRTVAVAGLVGVGIWLGTKLGDFSLSTGDGTESGGTTAVSLDPGDTPLGDPPPQADEPPLSDEPPAGGEPADQGGPPELVVIRIAEGVYLTRGKTSEFEEMSLEEAVGLAATATGTAEGHRVRIERTPKARAIDQTRLNEALAGVGVAESSIQRIGDFIAE